MMAQLLQQSTGMRTIVGILNTETTRHCSRYRSSRRHLVGPRIRFLDAGLDPSFASLDDQKRVMTPSEAVQEGANYLVIGRPIAKADDPLQAAQMIIDEIVSGAR